MVCCGRMVLYWWQQREESRVKRKFRLMGVGVKCKVYLPNISVDSIEAQVYYGQILDNGVVDNVKIIPMTLIDSNDEKREYEYQATVELTTGGNYGYTFRVMPKHEMVLDSANLNLIKWITK